MGGGPSAPAKEPEPEAKEPEAKRPENPPASAPASVAAVTSPPVAVKPSSPLLTSSKQQPSEPGPPSSSTKPGTEKSSKEIEQAAAGLAWGASHKEDPNAMPKGAMVGRLASAAVMNVELGEMGSSDSMVGLAPKLGPSERGSVSKMGALDEDQHDGRSSFRNSRNSLPRRSFNPEEGAEGSGYAHNSNGNNVQNIIRTHSIDSMNNLNCVHESPPAATTPSNTHTSSSTKGTPTVPPIAMPISDPDAPPDPWASLQAAYCHQHERDSMDTPRSKGQAIASGRHNSTSSFGESGMKSSRSNKPGKQRDTGPIPVLSEDEEDGSERVQKADTPIYTEKAPRLPALGRAPPKVVRAGQWGEGDMAVAGTLMLGEDVNKHRASYQHSSQSSSASAGYGLGGANGHRNHHSSAQKGILGGRTSTGVRQREEEGEDDLDISSLAPGTHRSSGGSNNGKGTIGRVMPPPDMSLEEIDDFDALQEAHHHTHAYSGLDAKMAAFDAMHNDDDDEY